EKAIRLHPMVCTAFNADFDGDQMAVHVPLSAEAQLEAHLLMLSSHNILSPQNGNPIVVPTQDIILGVYYLTKRRDGEKGEGKYFSTTAEALVAYDNGVVSLHAKIKVRSHGEIHDTSIGRVIFNGIVPDEMGFVNQLLLKKSFGAFISKMFMKLGNKVTAKFLDDLKDLGFRYSTEGGLSISFGDLLVPDEKTKYIDDAYEQVEGILSEYEQGFITDNERYNKTIDVWTHTTNNVSNALMRKLKLDDQGFNAIHMMVDSGARGSKEQVSQLAGMRGTMQKPQKSLSGQAGEIIENPIVASFKEGLSVLEYFLSTHGARKGLADTALKTADAGYLTRRLVDVAQDVIITEDDCGTILGIEVSAIKDMNDERESLAERVIGRVVQEDVYDPRTDEEIVFAGEMIDEETVAKIEDSSIDSIYIRTVLTCESPRGVCAKCYGRNLTNGKLVEIGEAVGVIAAQSIGEPGTQLTLRTFHLGGTSSRIASQSQVEAEVDGVVNYSRVNFVEKEEMNLFGDKVTVKVVTGRRGQLEVREEERVLKSYPVPYGATLLVDEGAEVKRKQPLYNHDPWNALILTDITGTVKFIDLIENETMQHVTDEQTGHVQKVVLEPRDRTLTPMVTIEGDDGEEKTFNLPSKAHISVDEGERVPAGTTLAKISKSQTKSRDITGGLPRVTELFEARSPQEPAIVSEIEGFVSFGARKKGSREIIVRSEDGHDEKKYNVPLSKHILVQDNDEIPAGEKITDGPINPHDILRIKGSNAVQEYLVNEIQEVYRMQGVKINDKHIEVIVRQMLQKVRVVHPGDTRFLEEDIVDRQEFRAENESLKDRLVVVDPGGSKLKEGQTLTRAKLRETNEDMKLKSRDEVEARDAEPATFENILLGITQAALSTRSFLSAASFQETTKVLANAAIAAKSDRLEGLKENVLMGGLIPAGTGLRKYRDLVVNLPEPEILETPEEEAVEGEPTEKPAAEPTSEAGASE
ncbi:MAG: DNA-directed RNA polymerase subunit beta', partial [Ignavibacteriales bacterium]|nr:DNA-directed RNA polymerase subunit beta' [Ignavibacteriales bacterium]